MPTDESKLAVLEGLRMFEGEDEDGSEDAGSEDAGSEDAGSVAPLARLPGGSRPLVSGAARALIREAHEEAPSTHEGPLSPSGEGDGGGGRLRVRPGQPTARPEIAQAARSMGSRASEPPRVSEPRASEPKSPCVRLRARLRASLELNQEASRMLRALQEQRAMSDDAMDAQLDEWEERLTDVMTS